MKKNVLVTGASRGIGRSIALAFADAGWNVGICCSQSPVALNHVYNEIIEKKVSCFQYVGDIGDFESAKAFITQAGEHLGPIHCLVNNAGISYIGLLMEMTPEEWQTVIRTNLTSVFNCCRLVIPGMVQMQTGSIINISSVWGICGASCEAAYAASKGGINALTKALAKELAPSQITVNAIACGAIHTSMNAFLSEEEEQCLIEEIPACRMGEPDEVAQLALSLAGEHPYLTGQIIALDGGWI